ncbi:ATP-binding cassette domain-containing protein [Ekhidna sp. To15]|uniref:ATP-binding cassette domain-containing protein n=1 Tax=Ekhidna sp. To15 TaxID=3395267 RepID=UPI003F528F82
MKGISLEIQSSETIVLLGPSGCGKTTLLKLINRLIEPDSGMIEIGGKSNTSVEKHILRRNIGYVIQDVGLLPHLTIKQNISLVNQIDEKSLSPDKLNELMELTGLAMDLLSKFPYQLSGGQQQRVGIARALANDPDLILMDEPFSALDNITRNELQDDFLSIPLLKGKTIIMVTHDVQEAFKIGDRIVLLDKGKIQQIGTPSELLSQPANDFVSSFLQKDRLVLFLQNQKIDNKSVIEFLKDEDVTKKEKQNRLAEILGTYHL